MSLGTLDLQQRTQTKDQEAKRGKIRLCPSNLLVDPFNLESGDIQIEDIAHSLACQTRYAGHCPMPFSIAEHSVRVSNRMMERQHYNTPELRLAALLHDAEEAYFLDMPSPIKAHPAMQDYRYEARVARRKIFLKFQLEPSLVDHVKWADDAEYYRERRDMWPPEGTGTFMVPWVWHAAESAFLRLFNELQYERSYGAARI